MASKKLEALRTLEQGRISAKKVMVFGLGRSGLAALKLLGEFDCDLHVASAGALSSWSSQVSVERAKCYEQSEAPFAQMDLIILSPGIPREHELLVTALEKNIPIICEIELASWFWRAPILGLTGTNGKTTTVTLLGEIFKDQKLKTFVGGNIGIPFCEAITSGEEFDVAILELSSFQLESAPTLHPIVSGILNITFSHGERYASLADYTQAKLNIAQNFTHADTFIAPLKADFLDPDFRSRIPVSEIALEEQALKNALSKWGISSTDLQVPGIHNLYNICFALEMTRSFFASESKRKLDIQALKQTLSRFRGVAHRIEAVPLRDGPLVYNDSKSTNWESTKVAVAAMKDAKAPVALILGGQKRGRADELSPHLSYLRQHVAKFYLIGQTCEQHALECEAAGVDYICAQTLEKVCRELKACQHHGTVLFSPAAPSFDQFKNYGDRGDTFKKLITQTFEANS